MSLNISSNVLLADGVLMLVNLDNQISFEFQFFPEEINTTDRNNWEPQETTIGVKPLFYANREPRQLDFSELYLDSTETNESLTPEVNELRALMNESDETGKPPALMAIWGDRTEQVVLQDLTISEIFFHQQGFPIRVRISMSLIQIQSEGGVSTSVEILDDKPPATRPRIVGSGTRPR